MLDVLTLYVMAAVVVTIATIAFVIEVAARGRSPVDLIWTLAFGGAVMTALFYLLAAGSDALWWFVALGNAASVITTFAMWNGVRAFDRRHPLLEVTGAAALITAVVALIPGPDGGEWAGGWAVLLGTAAGAALAAVAGVRGRLRSHRLGRMLIGVLTAVALYYLLRTAVFLAAGPDSDTFENYLGTGPTVVLVVALVMAASYCTVTIRAEEVHARGALTHGFDPVTGLRTPASFVPRAHELLRDAERTGRPVAVAAVTVESTEHLTTAFHPEAAEQAVTLVADLARLVHPPAALAGREEAGADTFHVLLLGFTTAEAAAWAESLRRSVIAAPLDVQGTRLRLRVSVGVACDTDGGYDLSTLQTVAAARVDEALARGGNVVLSRS